MIDPALDPLGAVEAAMLARLKSSFGWDDDKRALRQIKAIEFPFDQGTDKVMQLEPPGAYVVPLVARPTDTRNTLEQRWAIYAVSDRPTAKARATGGIGVYGMGAYAIAYRVAAALDEWDPETDGASRLYVEGIENMSGLTLTKRGLTVFGVTFFGKITHDFGSEDADLAPFLRFHADWDIAPVADPPTDPLPVAAPDAADDVTLEGDHS